MRFTAETPIDSRKIIAGPQSLGVDLHNLVWMFYRVRRWKCAGTIHAVGSPDSPVSFTLSLPDSSPFGNEQAAYENLHTYNGSGGDGSSPGTVGAFFTLPMDLCSFGGTDKFAGWTIPIPQFGVSYADTTGLICAAGNSVAGGAVTAYTITWHGSNLLDGLTFNQSISIQSSQGFGSFVDCTGSAVFSPETYWEYRDAGGLNPKYDSTTGALL